MNPTVSLIIPAYNEEERLESSISAAIDYLEKLEYDFEIVIVDDGSADGTADKAELLGGNVKVLRQPSNRGKGAAVRRGMLESSGSIKIFSDADFSTPIYETKKILDSLNNGYDICIGSRAVDESMIKEHQPWYREFMGKTFNKIVQLLVLPGIKDTQCGFKGFTDRAASIIFPKTQIDGFGFDVEVLYLARLNGMKIQEIPVEWYNDERSKVDPLKDSFRMLLDIFKVRQLHRDR